MTETNATILIPDISGFTEFITKTELYHNSRAINFLLDAIINAAAGEYGVSEIEGDAVLMYKNGSAPSQSEVQDACIKIFKAFHERKAQMTEMNICPCNTCLAITDLTLKFIVHHGPVQEIKIGGFTKLHGMEMIIAHRLMKNSVPSNEYLLLTDSLWQSWKNENDSNSFEWLALSDDYDSIGKVNYRFALLNKTRNQIPILPKQSHEYVKDDTPYHELLIETHFRDVYMVVMNIPDRSSWLPGLHKVEQAMPDVFVGSQHECTFDQYKATLSPLAMHMEPGQILYAESCRIPELELSLVYEYVFKKVSPDHCLVQYRILNQSEAPIPAETYKVISDQLNFRVEQLKLYCETAKPSFFRAN